MRKFKGRQDEIIADSNKLRQARADYRRRKAKEARDYDREKGLCFR